MWHFVLKLPLHEGRVDSVFSQDASRVPARCVLAAEQECWSPCALSLMSCVFEAWRCRRLPSPSCTVATSTRHSGAGRRAPPTWPRRTSSTPSSSRKKSRLWCLSKEFQHLARLHGLDFCLLSQRQRRCRGAHRQSAGPGQVRTSGKHAASGWKWCHRGLWDQF